MKKFKVIIVLLFLVNLFCVQSAMASGCTSVTLQLGETEGLYCGLYYDDGYDKNWVSSNPSVVTVVSFNGANCFVEAKSIGTCTVVFTTKYQRFEIIDYINGYPIFGYKEHSDDFTYDITVNQTGELVPGTVTIINEQPMRSGEKRIFRTSIKNTDNKYMRNYNQLSWFSSNEKVATVNQIGVITAWEEGTTEITAVTPQGVKSTTTITVTNLDDYIVISTKEQLNDLRENLNGKYILGDNIIFSEDDFEADGAFYNDGLGWLPIDKFTGILDGNGFYIQNINCQRPYAGLFSKLEGTVCNLEIKDSNISGTYYAGGFYAVGEKVQLISCKSTGNTISGRYAGGFGGENLNYSGRFSICRSTSAVSGTLYAGGIVGDGGSFQLCTNKGAVSSDTTANVGGIVGSASYDSELQYCYNEGEVSGLGYTGGLIGKSPVYTDIYKCFNTGKVIGNDASAYVGGIAGRAYTTFIADCYNEGELSVMAGDSSLIGGMAGNATNLTYSTGDYATVFLNCINNGRINIIGNEITRAGGIAATFTGHKSLAYTTIAQNSYFLDNICVEGIAWVQYGKTEKVLPLTAEQMKSSSSYPDFDFSRVWVMYPNDSHPKLQFEKLETSLDTIGVPHSIEVKAKSESSIELKWAAAGNTTGYQIYRATTSTGPFICISTVSSTNYTDKEVTADTTYYYKVQSCNTDGTNKLYGGYSSIATIKTEYEYSEYDIDQSKTITRKDMVLTADEYSFKKTDLLWEEKFDFNRDEIIDVVDLVMLAKHIE